MLSPNSPTSSTTELVTTTDPPSSGKRHRCGHDVRPVDRRRTGRTGDLGRGRLEFRRRVERLDRPARLVTDQLVEWEPQCDRGDVVRHDEHPLGGFVGDHHRLTIKSSRQPGALLEGIAAEQEGARTTLPCCIDDACLRSVERQDDCIDRAVGPARHIGSTRRRRRRRRQRDRWSTAPIQRRRRPRPQHGNRVRPRICDRLSNIVIDVATRSTMLPKSAPSRTNFMHPHRHELEKS